MGEPLEPPTRKSRGPMKGNRVSRPPQAHCPTQGVGGRLVPRAKGQTSSGRESATGFLTATWARGCPFHETFTFPGWHMRIICGCQLDCLGPTLSSTGRGMERGCTERRSFWALQNLLPALMACVPTKYGMQAVHVLQEGTKKPFHNHHGHLKGEFSGFPPPISYQAL